MKYIKIVFFCLSEKKEKGKSFSPAGDLHEITSKTLLLKDQYVALPESLWEMKSQAPPTN